MSQLEVNFPGGKKVDVAVKNFTVQTDQSRAGGGDESAPEPFTLFLASLASCAGIYALVFCESRSIDTSQMKLFMDTEYDPQKQMIGKVILKLAVTDDFPEKYDSAVIRAMNSCAVKRHLHPDLAVETAVVR